MCFKLLCISSYSGVFDIAHPPSWKIIRNESCINANVNFRLEKAFIFYCGDKITAILVIFCTNTKYASVLIEALRSTDLRLFQWLDDLKA